MVGKSLPQYAADVDVKHKQLQSLLIGLHLQAHYTGKITKEDAADFEKAVSELKTNLDIIVQVVNVLANIKGEKSHAPTRETTV